MAEKSEQVPKGSQKPVEDEQARIRNTALQHALALEEKKKIKGHILDLALQAFDLPSNIAADPAHPSAADLKLFIECLSLFSPNDLDELVEERNIDHRCGYALCPKPNRGKSRNGGKIWNGKLGGDFAFVDRAEKERWCSNECNERNTFVRRQLRTEPAWLRDERSTPVKLLDQLDSPQETETPKGEEQLQAEAEGEGKLQMLESERVGNGVRSSNDDITIVERETTKKPRPPRPDGRNLVEGFPLRQQPAPP